MLWNLGDGTDEDSGDAGFDEVVVNGDPIGSDAFFFKPSSTPGRVVVSATIPVPFTIEFAAEALAVDGLGGSDFVGPEGAAGLQGQIQLTINGGDGDDQLNGSDGADIIAGEEGSDLIFGEGGGDQVLGGTGSDQLFGDDGGDVIFGEGGDDRLLGGGGRDFVNDGEGDDVNVWNEGDGDDLVQGEAGFDRFEANGSPTAGDQFQIADHGAITTFERTNLEPSKIELEGFANEAISVNGEGGNDELVVSPGLPQLAVTADGGPGADKLTGAMEEDGFVGGPGNDTLALGGGSRHRRWRRRRRPARWGRRRRPPEEPRRNARRRPWRSRRRQRPDGPGHGGSGRRGGEPRRGTAPGGRTAWGGTAEPTSSRSNAPRRRQERHAADPRSGSGRQERQEVDREGARLLPGG